MVQLTKRGEGGDNHSERDIIFPNMVEVCERGWELFGGNNQMDSDYIAG